MVDELQARRTEAKESNRECTIEELLNLVLADRAKGRNKANSCLVILSERYEENGEPFIKQVCYRANVTPEQEIHDLELAIRRFWQGRDVE